jgi:hypothetical protein
MTVLHRKLVAVSALSFWGVLAVAAAAAPRPAAAPPPTAKIAPTGVSGSSMQRPGAHGTVGGPVKRTLGIDPSALPPRRR